MPSPKRQHPVIRGCRGLTHAAVLLALASGLATAGPRGGVVVSGEATVTQDGSHTQIETQTYRTKMNWQSFDIATEESVHVEQPTTGSILLNRVQDASVTTIDGSLTSNAQVWIVNPAGVYFGGSAVVEVAGLVAAAGEISHRAFVMGLKHFKNLEGEVRNDGTIRAKGVVLLGRTVANHGQIVTRGGDLVMAAGSDILISSRGSHIRVRMPETGELNLASPAVENTGSLDAGGGRARLAAGDFLGLAIRNSGEIHAAEIALVGGDESVIQVGGLLDASNDERDGVGGTIDVSGDWIVVDDAVLDASGTSGGGRIRVGGNVLGLPGELRSARGTFLGKGAELRADALEHGDGGQIVVWSDEVARVEGVLSAEGGADGGDGGFIETSSKGRIDLAADVSVAAPAGDPGLWLLDPANVAIVSPADLQNAIDMYEDIENGDVIEMLDIGSFGDVRFLPLQPPPNPPNESLVSSESLVRALERGGDVVVTTEALALNLTGDGVGYIDVRDPIIIASDATVRPNTQSHLVLLAADNILLLQDQDPMDPMNPEVRGIESNAPDLELSVTLRANDNELIAGSAGQEEESDQRRFGDVIIDVPIKTNGGSVNVSGTNVDITVNGSIDTRDVDSDESGGTVNLFAVDPVAANLIFGSNDDENKYGNVRMDGAIRTEGGAFISSGELYGQTGTIDAFRTTVQDPADEGGNFGLVQLGHSDTMAIDGDISAESILLTGASSGEGNLEIGLLGTNPTINATQIQLAAGDGAPSQRNDVDARILVDPGVTFRGPTLPGGANPTPAPEVFTFTQDAFIRDADLPEIGQFGDGVSGVGGMVYAITTFDGYTLEDDPTIPEFEPDIIISTPEKFAGSDLVLSAPDSVEVQNTITPRNVEVVFEEGFTVTAASGIANLAPLSDPDDDEVGNFRIHAGRSGAGDLDFEDADNLVLTADRIGLRAGDPDFFFPGDNGSGTDSVVNANGATTFETDRLEIRQDGDIAEANLPDATQLDPAGDLSGIEYSVFSEGGSITLTDASKVANTDLTLTALDGIDFDLLLSDGSPDPDPIPVHSADLGGFSGFEVTEDLLDGIDIQSGTDARVLTLRAGSGNLSFQDTKNIAPEGQPVEIVDLQLRVEADRIEIVGATIDVANGRPLFQQDPFTSPERLIFSQGGSVGDSVLPTADNYPDGLGPSELMVIRSTIGVALRQDAPQAPGPGQGDWLFPFQDQLVVSAPAVNLSRVDGFDLVLGSQDQIFGTEVTLQSSFDELGLEPICCATVDASLVGAILGYDASMDFTADDFGAPMDSEGLPLTTARFTVDQDDGFELRTGVSGLPDFDGAVDGDLAFQPGRYRLISREGSIEVDNAVLADTNLEITVDDPDEFIDFDGSSPLVVTSLLAQHGGEFIVGADDSGSDGATIEAEDVITLLSGLFGPANLSFAENVFLTALDVVLQAGVPTTQIDTSYVDARTNSPTFSVEGFQIFQGADLRNGLVHTDPLDEIDYGRVPDPTIQFPDYAPGSAPLERYLVETRVGDIEINDPSEVLIARSIVLSSGATNTPGVLTLRADVAPTSCAAGAVCATGTNPNLVLIGSGSDAQALALRGEAILLEAPEGYVDAGDSRVLFQLVGLQPVFGLRQGDPITVDDAGRLPAGSQFLSGIDSAPYLLQAVNELSPGDGVSIAIGEAASQRIERTNLILTAGVSEEEFERAFGTERLGGPVTDPDDPDAPVRIYDRLADLNGDGLVDVADEAIFDTLAPVSVAINDDAQTFDLLLRNLTIESTPGDGAPIQLGSVRIRTEADQIYRDEVQLVGQLLDDDGLLIPTELTARAGLLALLSPTLTPPASSIVFENNVYGSSDGGEALVVNATNRIRFLDEIGVDEAGTETRLGSLTLNLQQIVALDENPPIVRAEFGSSDFPGTFRVLANEVLLNPTAGDSNSLYARTEVPEGATLFRRGGSLEFDVGSGGTFVMGENEKLSVDGPELTILGDGGAITIGDLAALDKITVDAGDGDIHIQTRDGGRVRRANGEKVNDRGVDFVAKEIDFVFGFDPATDPTGGATLHANQLGGGKDARFGIADTTQAPSFMSDFSVLGLQFNILSAEGFDFLGGDLPIDGIPDGISRAALGDAFAGVRPDVPIAVPATYRVQRPEMLRNVGMELREPTPSELRSAASGAGTFYDLGSIRPDGSGKLDVSEVRLIAHEIERAAVLFDRIFAPDGSRAPQVRATLQAAADDYRRSTGARRIVGFELRRYVYNRPSSQFHAYQELQSLDALFRHHRRSGLTPTEYGRIQHAWLEAIQPEGVSLRELAEFIHPSRYVRGSDVLDVFGD